VAGSTASPAPQQRTVISHRDLADAVDDFVDDEDQVNGADYDDTPARPVANGALLESADKLFERAASATPGPAAKSTPKSTGDTPATISTKKTPKSPKAAPVKATKTS
jgi:hypothetical protein